MMKTIHLFFDYFGKAINLFGLLFVEVLCDFGQIFIALTDNKKSAPTFGHQDDPLLSSLYGDNDMMYHLAATKKWKENNNVDDDCG